MKKRLFALALALCLAASLLPAGALAADGEVIYVGGVELQGSGEAAAYATTDADTGYVTLQADFAESDPWNIKWDGETLTLRDAKFTGMHEFGSSSNAGSAAIYRDGGLKIELVGENTATNTSGSDSHNNSYGIFANGDLTISGSGSLAATGGGALNFSYGIYANNSDITVEGGDVTATGGDTTQSTGIYAFNGFFTVNGGSVTATGGEAGTFSTGIEAYYGFTIEGGTVTATGGDTGSYSDGISCGIDAGDVTINGGSVKATGDAAGYYSCGIDAYDVTVNGGSVTATGGEAGAFSFGIYAYESVTINGGSVTAEGKTGCITNGDPAGGGTVTVSPPEDMSIRVEMRGPDGTETQIVSGYTELGVSSKTYFNSELSHGPNIYVGGVGLYGSKDDGTTAYATTDADTGYVTLQADFAESDPWNIKWDGETLTLNGANISGEYEFDIGSNTGSSAIYRDDGMKIELVGENTVTNTGGGDSNDGSYGIFADGDLTISGSGSLAATGGAADYSSCGIYGYGIAIEGCDVTATGGAAYYSSCGIEAADDVTINDGTVMATGGEAEDTTGIYAYDVIIESGTVTATGDAAEEDGYGIYAYDVIIESGTVTATGDAAGYYSCGIYADDSVTINGGSLTATGDAAGYYSCGIDAYDVTVNGGDVTATGDAAGYYSDGIDAYDVTVNDGTVTAAGGLAEESTGIYADDITINGGTVRAAGSDLSIVNGTAPEYSAGIYADGGDIVISGGVVQANGGAVIENGRSYGVAAMSDEGEGGSIIASGGSIEAFGFTNGISGDLAARPADGSQIEMSTYSVMIPGDDPSLGDALDWQAMSDAASEIDGSPFTAETDVEETLINLYFKSITTALEPGTDPDEPDDDPVRPSGGGGSTTYPPTVEDMDNGSVSTSPRNPERGDEVTITAKPEDGYEVDKVTVTDKRGNEVEVTENKDGTYTFEQPAGRVTIEVTFREITAELPFTDISDDAWYADAVRFVYENGMMLGVSETSFAPNITTSRSMIVTILYRMEGEPEATGGMFTDVADGAWYTEAVRWAASEGIAGGYGSGLFGPDDPVTREQLATILYRYAIYKGYDVSIGEDTNILSYEDFDQISEYAIPALQWACGTGIINGTSESTLFPQGQATRVQTAAMLERFCQQNS